MSNTLKIPSINQDTKVLSFDLESNGLHGEVFAIGAAIIDGRGKIHDEFTGRCEIEGNVDEWVDKNVIPVISDMEITHSSQKHLRDHFWAWFQKAMLSSDYVIVTNGYPVEYRFLAQCQDDDIETRFWDHPFPILDVTSFLIGKGYTGESDTSIQALKNKAMSESKGNIDGSPHHPLYDAKVSAYVLFRAALKDS